MLKTSAIAYWTFISELLLAGSIVACSKSKNSPAPAAGQAPAAVVVRETVDTIAPAPVVILLPQPQPYASSESLFEVSGTCEPAALVMVSADTPLAIEETRCTDYSTFALPVSQNNDGTYTYSFRQKDAAGNLSEPVTFVWTRQTSQSSGTGSGSNTASVPPAVIDPPVVAVPASNSFSSNLPAFSLSGTCTTGLTVRLTRPSGGGNLDSTCVGSAFIFPAVSESLAGSYTYSLVQVDSSGQQSAAVQRTWIRDLTAPSVPVRTLPATSPFTSSGSLGISGACESGATVHLAGASTQSIACVSSAFAFSVSSLPAGFYLFTLSQTDAAGNSSMPSAPFQWVRDTTSPATPTIISPSSSPYTSSGNLTISGFCELNATVNLAGSSSQSTPCSGGSFSFTVNSLPAGNHSFTVSQTDVAGNLSTPSLPLQWNRDVTAPSVPTITSPSSNPYESGGVLIISGACETGASVHLAGSASQSVMCLAGGYNFTVSSLSDGHHNFSVSQTDTAGNVSASSSVFQWVRDTAAPVTPTIISPSANPHSSGGNLVISGSCESGATVNLAGSSAQSASCSSGAFSFSVSGLSDGSYNFTLSQTDAAGNSSMPSAPLVWIRDATSPAAPTIISPSSNPYTSGGNLTISGGCETGATVYLAGSATQSAMCLSSAYTFNINSLANGTHNFTVSQTDSTGNTSPAASNPVLQWTRNSTVPPTPTISTPASSPYFSSGFLIISGVCEAGANVFLSGASVQSTPCSSLSYSFTVSGLSEGTHNFSLSQTSSAGISSASPALLQWTLDTTQPATPTIISPSSNPYASSGNLTISGGCETGATVSLAGASSQSALCSSSIYSFGVSSQPYATHNFSITQTDAAGNSSSAAALQWTRSPSAPTLSSPAGFASGGTYSSNTPSLVLAGSCESGLTVTLSGAVAASDVTVPEGSLTQTCSSSNFSFTISKSVDATYAINVRQGSSADTTLNWIRNTFVAPPAITVPATDPFSGNTTFFSLSGTCINGHTVRISSSSGSAPQVTSCSTSAFNFAVVSESSDGSYTYSVVQIDSAGNQSGAVQRTWLRDTLAPAVPTITSPSTSPHTSSGNLTISGGCETNATVNLSGSASQSTTCTASVYSFSFSASVDATYNFLISQTDEVGNASSAASLQWIRTTPSDPAPSITLPAGYSSGGSYTSNSANLVLQGGCQTGLTVTLSGDVVAADVTSPSASLTQTCASSQFSFTIAKTVDGTYAINVRQGTSSNTTLNWTKNTFVAPPTIT
ncbi:MAG: hypothetical protein EBR09_14495, partial [Proteobacteria bacterium]|nr:hypothetical protein [Pseudomonadota bacterium]